MPKKSLPHSHILLYQTEDGQQRIEVRLENETVWLTINEMADLFQIDKSGISKHLKNVFETNELQQDATVAKIATVRQEGTRNIERQLEYYNLDAIISVGYRVNSLRGTHFRMWATGRLREYLIKGFTLDDRRLKEAGGGNYFDELLSRIRDIRSSEKVFWRKVLDIYATSIDYDPKIDTSKQFFATVQNKMHWAAHGHTAAEIIYGRADATRANMGLMHWPGRHPCKADIEIAKNYLNADELNILNRLVSMYLDFAELQALNRQPMHMKDWISKLDDFLRMTARDILSHSGKISHDEALDKAQAEYAKYQQQPTNRPSAVEQHFLEVIQEFKQINPDKV